MLLLDGKKARDFYTQLLTAKIQKLGFSPSLAILQVGDNLSSTAYIEQKKKFGMKIGVNVEHLKFPETVTFEELKNKISTLNADKKTNAIIVQLPLPAHLDKTSVINLLESTKDVDGLTSNTKFIPATARGVKALLDFYEISPKGKKVAMLGRSALVGKPTAELLKNAGADVTICHSQTSNTREVTRNSDIIIVAIGKPRFVDETYIGGNFPVVVDVGISPLKGKLVGDVDFEKVKDLVLAISPVPGGVGPMTVLSLFENVVLAASKR